MFYTISELIDLDLAWLFVFKSLYEIFCAIEIPEINIKKRRYLPPEKSLVAPTKSKVVKEIKKNFVI